MRLTDFFQEQHGQLRLIEFPQEHHRKGFIKTIRVYKSKRDDPDELKYFNLILSDPEPSHSCPLFRKYGEMLFLQLIFYKDCPEKVIKLLIENGLKIYIRSSRKTYLYKFFGHSPTQLRNKACILYDDSLLYNEIINSFGEFPSNNVAKRAARIGLLLSESTVLVQLQNQQIQEVEDTISDGYTFTDGCGFISLEVAQRVVENLKCKDSIFKKSFDDNFAAREFQVPSVFQVRIKGCKGVLMLTTDPKWKNCVVIRRPSMEKFKWKLGAPHSLGICDSGKALSFPNHYGSLNKQVIRLLSGLGVPDDVFLKKQEKLFKDLQSIDCDQNVQVQFLCATRHFYEAETILHRGATDENARKALKTIIRKYVFMPGTGKSKNLSSKNTEIREKKRTDFGRLKIPIEESRCVFGVADPSGKLDYGTCFFQPTICSDKPTVLENQYVFVARSPAYHPGDIRTLKCVNIPECRHLIDCIVFPVKGKRPHPDELSGGDLDGDIFLVCWDKELLPRKSVPATLYPGDSKNLCGDIGYSDLVRYFIEYDARIPGQLDRLYSAWADAKGVNCHECRYIANIFNIAIDSAKTGKEIDIPSEMPHPDIKKQQFVWQKMIERAENFKQDNCIIASLKGLSDKAHPMHFFDEDSILSLLESDENRIPEYNLFRLIYKWREHRDVETDSKSRNFFKELMAKIKFTRLTDVQRRLATVDLEPLGSEFTRLVMNALYCSSILSDSNIDLLQNGLKLKEYNWVYYCGIEENSISWKLINDALQMPNLKLIVLKFKTLDQKEMILAVGVYGKMVLHGTVRVKSSGLNAVVFMFDHHEVDANASSVQLPLGEEYELALDGDRLQMYDSGKSDRGNTFICLQNNKEDDSMVLSVDLQRFRNHRGLFYSRHDRMKIKKSQLMHFEIFINSPKPTVAPSIRVNTAPDQFLHEEKLSSDLLRTVTPVHKQTELNFDELNEKYSNLERKIAAGESVIDDLRNWLHAVVDNLEYHREDVKCIEILLQKSQKNAGLLQEEEYLQLLKALLQTSASVAAIERLLGTMAEVKRCLSWKQFANLMNHLIFCCNDRNLSVEFLNYVHTGENFQLQSSSFYSFEASNYFLQWLPLVTIEFLHSVIKMEKMEQTDIITARPFLTKVECGDQMIRKVTLSCEGPSKPFLRENGLTFSFHQPMQQPVVFFAEIINVDGAILTIRIVWPEQLDAIDQLERLLENHTLDSDVFYVGAFPNLVTYRIQVEALKAACITNYVEPKPTRIVREIINSFGGYLDKVKDLQMEKCKKELFQVLRPLCSNATSDLALDVASGLPLDDSDLVTDEPEPESNLQHIDTNLVENMPAKKRVAFNLEEIRHNIPCRTNLPPRLEKKEQRKRAVSAGRMPRVNLLEPEVNQSQRNAILDAVDKNLTLIQGPPGTGKTWVAAIIVREWLKVEKHSKVLVTAASNQAIVNIYRKLLEVGIQRELIHYVGRTEDLPADVQRGSHKLEYLKRASRSQRRVHDSRLAQAILQDYQVVCSTCTGSGLALLKSTCFKYVLVDEAAQAQEILTLVPLCTGVETVCFVGDDKQLNPIVHSRLADKLKISLFERLRQSGVPVHLLNVQYRMHPFLALFPSKHFYDNNLENGVDGGPSISGLGVWPDQTKPIVFYNIEDGYDESRGTSKQNCQEAEKVRQVVTELTMNCDIKLSDIGVISPYKAQVVLLQECLKKDFGNTAVELVQTVDGFQGQERPIIIISTVRANKEVGQKPVGFLSEPSRINVLLTRAQRGLVVIGNQKTLERDPLWKSWIEFVSEHNLVVREQRNRGQGQHRGQQRSRDEGYFKDTGERRGQREFHQRRGTDRGRGQGLYQERGQQMNRGQQFSRGQGEMTTQGQEYYRSQGQTMNRGQAFGQTQEQTMSRGQVPYRRQGHMSHQRQMRPGRARGYGNRGQ